MKMVLLRQFLAGLTVSFVAISLGAAFGVMSGRGPIAGILSAGVIALITATFGGTRIQCSGPTAPMTAVMVLLVSAASSGLLDELPSADPEKFINLVLLLTGILLVGAGALRLGKFIRLVPAVVISGFMNGIAVLIWLGESKPLFGLGAGKPYGGGISVNLCISLSTVALVCFIPILTKRIGNVLNALLPASLVAIVIMTVVCMVLPLDIQRVSLVDSLSSLADFQHMVQRNLPTDWSIDLVWLAMPFAFQFAMLAYLDTLLTSLVVEKNYKEKYGVEEKTKPNKELLAQGLGNATVSIFGGIPGAQATIRSVLIINEGATMRLAGVFVGILVLVEMILCQNLISLIPQAVFSGILLKVGYDVFDWKPVGSFIRRWNRRPLVKPHMHVSIGAAVFIMGTMLITVLFDLTIAVLVFSLLFYAVRNWIELELLEVNSSTSSTG